MFLIVFFIIYQLIQIITIPILFGYFIFRFFKKKPLGTIKERLGLVPPTPQNTPVLWIHAVSVGEVLAVEYFINAYKKTHPSSHCYLTTGTIGGMLMAKKLNADQVSFIPFDFLLPMYLAFKRIKPTTLIIVEAEIWPNLLMLAHVKKIPCYLLNGRINEKSASRRQFIGFLYKLFTHIFAQSERDVSQFQAMGISRQKISLFGDIKTFNVVEKKQALLATQPANNVPHNPYVIILAGSIHAGEVDTYLDTFTALKKTHPNLRLILVPRHFHWQQEVITKLTNHNITYDAWTNATPHPSSLCKLEEEVLNLFATHEVLVVCKLGILFSLYRISTIFCLGGTFVPVGGHNLLEPAVWGKPCLVGPHFHKCASIVTALSAAGGLIKTTPHNIQHHLNTLANHPGTCINMGNANKDLVALQAETIKKNLYKFIDFLP